MLPEMRIRPAVPGDAARIIEMTTAVSAHEGLGTPGITAACLVRFAFTERLLDIFVAAADDTLIGHVITTLSFDVQCGAPARWIADLYVEPPHRRRGVATRLMAAVARQALGEGAVYIQWMMRPGNIEAERFYKSIGARRDGGVAMFLRRQEFEELC